MISGTRPPGQVLTLPLIVTSSQWLVLSGSSFLLSRMRFRVQFHSLSRVWLFATPWTAAQQASLSTTNSQSLLKLMSIESVIPSNHLILCHPILLPPSIFSGIRIFSDESVIHIRWPKNWSFSSASVLPMKIPLGLTGWISLKSKGLSRVFSNITVQKHQFLSPQFSL